ncbi:hypothetical protein AVEN_272970-1 [Araneus ventricosus]|uniref:Uncharacterized protein n=1 Tax=Araneus ventricosus TaxID=182803 RepID=A0A4Y2TF15_ARAVE|nr:hypothetical protein AVEN_272970-1 [Araneus ventricosus]
MSYKSVRFRLPLIGHSNTNARRANQCSEFQRDTRRSKALAHITSPHNHHGCRSICSICQPTYRNQHRRNQSQDRGATSRRLTEYRQWFGNAKPPDNSSVIQSDENHLM